MKLSSTVIGDSVSIGYTPLIAEYMAAEILEIAGQQAKTAKPSRKRISPEDVTLAIRGDVELARLCSGIVVYSGDKIQGVEYALKPKKRAASA